MTDDDLLQQHPDDRIAGDGPMTDAQRTQMDILAAQTGEPTPDDHLNRAEADQVIHELREEAVGYDTNTDDLDEP